MAKAIYKQLSTSVLIDSTALKALSTKDIQVELSKVQGFKKPLIFVDSFHLLNNKTQIMEDIIKGESVDHILEFLIDRPLTMEEVNLLTNTKEQVQKTLGLLSLIKVPEYLFTEVPENKSINSFYVTKTYIARVKGSYSIGIKTLERLWLKASPYWANKTKSPESTHVSASGYSRQATFWNNRIEIGCQTIARWELELFAQHFGWKFP